MSHDIANRCHGDEWSSGEGCEGIWPGGDAPFLRKKRRCLTTVDLTSQRIALELRSELRNV